MLYRYFFKKKFGDFDHFFVSFARRKGKIPLEYIKSHYKTKKEKKRKIQIIKEVHQSASLDLDKNYTPPKI